MAPSVAITVRTNPINIGNVSSVGASGTREAGATISLVVTDTHGHSTSGTDNGAGTTWSVGGLNLSTFTDGDVITYTATATDGSSNTTIVTATASKDTVAPSVAITVRTNPINIGNVSSVGASGTREAGATISLVVTDTHGHSTSGTDNGAGTTWSVGGLNLSTFTDGDVITYTATATDGSSNTTTVTATASKDTVAPSVAITVRTNPINIGNVSSVGASGTREAGATISLVVTDTHGHSTSGTDNGAGTTWSVGGLNLSTFTDGDVITYTATATDRLQHHLVTATATKDTVAPALAITVRTNPINIGNVSSVGASGTREAGATISLVVTDTHGHSTSGTDNGAGTTWSVGGLNLSTFTDGDVITYTATATDGSSNTTTVTATATKDTVAPSVAITVRTNPINIGNVSSVGASGTREAGATISLVVTDTHGHSTSGTDNGAGTTWSVGGLNLSTFTDGDVITYTATATDGSSNTTIVTATASKDTVAPSVAITVRTNPINIGNVGSRGRLRHP